MSKILSCWNFFIAEKLAKAIEKNWFFYRASSSVFYFSGLISTEQSTNAIWSMKQQQKKFQFLPKIFAFFGWDLAEKVSGFFGDFRDIFKYCFETPISPNLRRESIQLLATEMSVSLSVETCFWDRQLTHLIRTAIRVSSFPYGTCCTLSFPDAFSKETLIPICSSRSEFATTRVASRPEDAFIELIANSILGATT